MTILGHNSHHPRIIEFLKIDIEISEWSLLRDVIETGELSRRVKQLAVEIHSIKRANEVVSVDDYITMLRILKGLYIVVDKFYLFSHLVYICNYCPDSE